MKCKVWAGSFHGIFYLMKSKYIKILFIEYDMLYEALCLDGCSA